MEDILLDANMLLVPFQFNVDVFDEIDRLFDNPSVYTVDRCVEEARTVEDGKYAAMVDRLVETQDLTVLTTEQQDAPVDDVLQRYAVEGYIIATNDAELRAAVEDKGYPTVYLRSGSHLATTAFK